MAPALARRRTQHDDVSSLTLLKGKKALVTGIANDQSIAWGLCQGLRRFGADGRVTYLNGQDTHLRWSRWRERSMHRCCCRST